MTKSEQTQMKSTFPVDEELFRQVYDSPSSLPGKERWLTRDEDVRHIEKLLDMDPGTIGAPLWVSGDTKKCKECDRETNWLDIVASAVSVVHNKRMLAQVILGDRKFVNVEAPRAIAGLRCFGCGAEIRDLRSFKCHNWAYAIGDLGEVIRRMDARQARAAETQRGL